MTFAGWPEEALDPDEGLQADAAKASWTDREQVQDDGVRAPSGCWSPAAGTPWRPTRSTLGTCSVRPSAWSRAVRRLLPLALAATALLPLAPAAATAGEDLYSIDGVLEEAGYDQAYTEVYEAASGSGYRVVLDFDGDSADRAEYEEQARGAAELLWGRLEGELLVVDVAPAHRVDWVSSGLPPALSFTREDLQTAFGPRPPGLDEGDVFAGEEAFEDPFAAEGLGTAAVVVALGVLLLLVGGVVLAVVLHGRRSRAQPVATWGGQPWDAPEPGRDPWAAPPP